MTNIELVIKIPEHYYKNNIKNHLPIYLTEDNIVKILPKGHGRIIDESQVTQVYMQAANEEKYINGVRIPPTIYISSTNAPTIVEAYKAESEE